MDLLNSNSKYSVEQILDENDYNFSEVGESAFFSSNESDSGTHNCINLSTTSRIGYLSDLLGKISARHHSSHNHTSIVFIPMKVMMIINQLRVVKWTLIYIHSLMFLLPVQCKNS
ncbi:unnamed protein product [Rotaria magnacalcarata]